MSYVEYSGVAGPDPRLARTEEVLEGVVRIVAVEGPMVAKRAFDIYLRGCGVKRMGHEIRSTMERALEEAIRSQRVAAEREGPESELLFSVVRLDTQPPIAPRSRGPRSFEEIPPSELQAVARVLSEGHAFPTSDEHLRAILEWFELKRLTTNVGTTLLEILERNLPHVEAFIRDLTQHPPE